MNRPSPSFSQIGRIPAASAHLGTASGTDHVSHCRINAQSLGVVGVLVAGQAAVDRLPQQISERKLRVLPPVRIPLMPISDSGAMPITVGA